MFPIDFMGALQQRMSDISAVKTFSLHDVGFLPKDLFEWRDSHRCVQDDASQRTRKPRIIYHAEPAA
jgi:hypothetical protein